jgi:hypothetical protein
MLAAALLVAELPQRWRHVAAAGGEAQRIADVFGGDGAELVAAAWLHDVGYASELADTGFHPVDGARFLRAGGWPARVCGLVAHHSGAVHEAELRRLGAELAEFGDEGPTPVRDALWYCDLTTGPAGERVAVDARLREIGERYGAGDVVARSVELAAPELVGAVERTRVRLRAAGLDQPM